MTPISLSADGALHLWVQVAALLALARLLGSLARRFGQPDIVGSLVAGLLLGPSVLGQISPRAADWFLPHGSGGGLLGAVASFSLLVLLVVLGAETDLGLLRTLGRPAAWVSTTSVLIPLGAGLAAAWMYAADLVPHGHSRLLGAALLGGALGVSSLPVVARTIIELGMARRTFGQLSFAAATVNDLYGFLLLTVAAVAASSGGATGAIRPLVGLAALVLLLAVAGQRMVDALLRGARAGGPNVAGSLSLSLIFAFACAAVVQAVEVEASLGAFLAGIVLGRSRFQHGESMRLLENFTTAVFAPLYFATAGLQVDLASLRGNTVAALGVLFVVAVVAKAASALLGSALGRLTRREGVALAVSLNGRGAMQVIIGTAGLRLDLLSEQAYTILLLVSLVSSIAVAPTLRRVAGDWPGTEEEQQRLQHEERLRTNVIVRGQRLLLPTRGSANSMTAALLLDRGWPEESELTLFSIGDAGELPDEAVPVRPGRALRRQHTDEEDPAAAVLAEANLGYGVIGVGTVDQPTGQEIVTPLVATLLSRSPLPILLVRRPSRDDAAPPRDFRRIAVAVTGSAASRAAEEVAHNIAGNTGASLHLVHVVTRPDEQRPRRRRGRYGAALAGGSSMPASASGAATAVLTEAGGQAAEQGVFPQVVRRKGGSAGEEICRFVEESAADLVLMGVRVRRVGDRAFLGHTVEHVLEHARDATVAVVVLPDADVLTESTEPYADRSAR